MIKRLLAAALAAMLAGCVPTNTAVAPVATTAISNPRVGGAVMDPAATIAANAAKSSDHTTLMRAVAAAGLADRLSGGDPVTVFAPTNAAFDKLPPTTVETLLDPANRALLARLVGYHVVPGRKTRAQILSDVRAGGGSALYRTEGGGTVRVRADGGYITLTDVHNGRSTVTQPDVIQSNGVIHVVGSVLIPAIG